MSNAATAFEILKGQEGDDQGHSDWVDVDQERIQQFADATLDHQFIHLDEARAKAETPFGGTIAHGFLTLSLLSHLGASIKVDTPKVDGVVMGINYGLNKVRFLTPVPSGSRVRAHAVVSDVTLKGSAIDQTRTMTIEIDGIEKPAMVAEWITRIVFDS